MTTAIVHGDPGSYKTSSLVNDYLVPAVKSGRVVVTNIRGVKTPQEIADIYKFDLPDTADIILVPFDQAGFEMMARFFHWVPLGALILMDEGQRVYPTRLRDFKVYDNAQHADRPKTVEDAFDSHRHLNWDIYISTPNISKIHKEIRAVAEYGFRHKNLATVFSFLQGRYKRVVHIAENSGVAVSNTVSATIKKMDKRCFDVYQSTATGKAKDATSSVSLFKQPKVIFLMLIVVYSIWNMGSNLLRAGGVPALLGGSAKPSVSAPLSNAHPVSSAPRSSDATGSVSFRQPDQNPFLGATFYLVGEFNNAIQFMVELPDKSSLVYTLSDLQSLGYNVAQLNPNLFKFTFGSQSFFVYSRPRQLIAVQPVVDQPNLGAVN